jgi:hypothetical protein
MNNINVVKKLMYETHSRPLGSTCHSAILMMTKNDMNRKMYKKEYHSQLKHSKVIN